MAYFIGIDGGGTKTAFALADGDGRVLASGVQGSASYKQVGADGVVGMVAQGVRGLLSRAGVAGRAGVSICFGMPNFGESVRSDQEMRKKLDEALDGAPVRLVNDSEVAWAGSLLLKEGINIVAGTGSIAFGKDWRGESKSAGGWNDWFSDEGSCKWLGIRCMELFSKEADGRLKKGPLYDIVRERFGLRQDIDLIDIFERDYQPYRDKVASLQRVLMEAALAGDGAALEAYDDAAEELGGILKAVHQGLDFPNLCPVSYSGGLFKSGELILRPLRERIAGNRMELVEPRCTPVMGAVLLAKYGADGGEVDEGFVGRLLEGGMD